MKILQGLLDQAFQVNIVTYNAASSVLLRHQHWALALRVVAECQGLLLRADVISVNAAIRACNAAESPLSRWFGALCFLQDAINHTLRLDLIAYSSSLHGEVLAWRSNLNLLSYINQQTLQLDVVASSTAMTTYQKGNLWDVSLHLFANFHQPNQIMCNAAVSSCEEGAQWSKALLLLEDLSNDRRMGMSCDIITFNSAISACEKSSHWRWALEVLMQADETLHLDVISFSASISACEKAGKWQHALNLYSEFLLRALQMDLIIYNAMISACEKGGQWQAALHFMGHLVSNGLKPDQISHNALLSAFQKGQQWQKALHTFQELRSAGTMNLISYNSVMRACIDHWTLALQLFTDLKKECHEFPRGDLVTYSSLISACEKGQQWCLALRIFEDSQRQEVLFDSILYMATISAVKSKWRIVLDLLAELRMRHFSIDTDAYDVILSSCEQGGVAKNASTFLRELQDEAISLILSSQKSDVWGTVGTLGEHVL